MREADKSFDADVTNVLRFVAVEGEDVLDDDVVRARLLSSIEACIERQGSRELGLTVLRMVLAEVMRASLRHRAELVEEMAELREIAHRAGVDPARARCPTCPH